MLYNIFSPSHLLTLSPSHPLTLAHIHELMPSVVPMAVSIVTSVWMMIFQVSFFMALFGLMVKNKVNYSLSKPRLPRQPLPLGGVGGGCHSGELEGAFTRRPPPRLRCLRCTP